MKQKQQEAQLAASERAERTKKLHEQQGRFHVRPLFWQKLTGIQIESLSGEVLRPEAK